MPNDDASLDSRRRALMKSAATLGFASALAGTTASAAAGSVASIRLTDQHRRKLGELEVSSIGPGCMQMAGPVYGVQVERGTWSPTSAQSAFNSPQVS